MSVKEFESTVNSMNESDKSLLILQLLDDMLALGVDEIDMVNLDNESIELEIIRTVEECLKAHPLTKSVQSFEFFWLDDVVMYDFELTYNLGNSTTLLSGTLEMR